MVKPKDRPLPEDWDEIADILVQGQGRARLAIRYVPTEGPHLDVGTGQGQFLEELRKANISCFGLDYGWGSTSICKDKGFDVVQGDAHHLPFAAESFASISLLDVIEHVPTPGSVLRESSRTLVKNGRLILTTPDKFSLREVLLHITRKIGLVSYKQPYDKPIALSKLQELMACSDLEVEHVTKYNSYYLILARSVKQA